MRLPLPSAARAAPVALLAVLALSCGEAPTGLDAIRQQARAPAEVPPAENAGGNKVFDVISRNLYLGADLGPALSATTPAGFVAATTEIWAKVQANDFSIRVEAIADEIAAIRPALIGLQEAYLWRIQSPGDALVGGSAPAETVVYDYVALLVDALAARGLAYAPAAEVTLFDFEAPIATGDDIRMTDRGVVLARRDVKTTGGAGQVFETLLPVQVLGRPVPIPRGWASVEAKIRGEWIRFATVHLEAFHPGVRLAQAGELAAALAPEARPTVLVGDLNAAPGTGAAALLASAGFEDVWATLLPGAPGLTCCFPELLSEDGALGSRIDYVLIRGAISARAASLLGDQPGDRVSGLWPSDHAGVAATVRVGEPPGRR